MDEAKKKQLQQVAVLIVLLIVLGVASMYMMGRNAASSGGGAATADAASKPSTAMAEAGITDTDRQNMGGSTSVPGGAATNAMKLNPNMWRVYALAPPRNPFVEEESWYAGTFKELLPGYPQLRDSGFFEKRGEVLPDINRLFPNMKFEYIDLNRSFKEINRTLNGESKDGKMLTSLTLSEERPDDIQMTFDGSGNPVRKEEIQRAGRGGSVDGEGGPGGLPPLGDGSGFFGDGSMPVMQPQGGGAMAVHGISIHSGKATALVRSGESTRLVEVGDALSANYSVTKITGSGIEVKDTRTGEKKFIEIAEPGKEDNSARPAMMRGLSME
jgi:hypothetical protein